jgi:resuscitation-promoting factor RpfB
MLLKASRVAILVSLGIATFTYGSVGKHVTVRVEGKPVSVQTSAATVGDALSRAGIDVGPLDTVRPSPVSSIREGTTIDVQRAKPVTVLLDGKARTVMVTGLTVQQVLQQLAVRGQMADAVTPPRGARVEPGMTIIYSRAIGLIVVHDDQRQRVVTNAKTVGAVVRELGIKLGAHDMLVPPASARPTQGMTIQILRVGVRHEVVRSRMHYSTVLRRDRNLDYGTHKVIQNGRDGLRLIRYESRYVQGHKATRRIIGSQWLTTPIPRIIAIGAKYANCSCKSGTQTGGASWYGEANGMTAAHKTLPFGTVVRVENMANHKVISVTIRDRGPYVAGRVIDLSDEAFRRLAPLGSGVIKVRISW